MLDAETPVCCVVGKSWDLHVDVVFKTTLDENLAMIRDSVRFLKSKGREVIFDAEHFFDGYRANAAYALACLKAAEEAGSDSACLCDTNGGSTPSYVGEVVSAARGAVTMPLGIHCHNDGDMATANSISAVEAGATMVQGDRKSVV